METETKEAENQKRPDRRILSKNLFSTRVLLRLLLVAAMLGGGGWYFLTHHQVGKPTVPVTLPPPPPPAVPVTPKMAPPPEKTACQEIDEQIAQFFTSLDNKDLIVARQFKGGSHAHFAHLVDTILSHPPVVVNENKELTSILHNTAHFYRILGKGELFLIRDLLNQSDGNSVEAAMALFYRWSEQMPQCGETTTKIRLPLPELYEYACFFLNTLGGQSYVFRRDPKVRLLVRYYSILILDRANDASLNRYGLDIRPPIASLLQELRSVSGLAGQEDYTAKLLALQDKYLPEGLRNRQPRDK